MINDKLGFYCVKSSGPSNCMSLNLLISNLVYTIDDFVPVVSCFLISFIDSFINILVIMHVEKMNFCCFFK